MIQYFQVPAPGKAGYMNNAYIMEDGKRYRVRSELLVLNNEGKIYAIKRDTLLTMV